MTAQQLDDLLRASLELWQCAAVLAPRARDDAMQAPLQAWLVLPDGTSLAVIEAAPDDEPFHWWLQWHGQGAPGAGPVLRRKPCASTLGLLRSLREGLGVAAVARVRIGIGAGSLTGSGDTQ